MKDFIIAIDYRICGTVNVKANSWKEAIDKAYDCNTTEVEDKEYIDDSWQVNIKMSEEFKDSLKTIGELQKELATKGADSDNRLKERDSLIAELRDALTKEVSARKSKEKILGDSLRTAFAELKIDKKILENATLEQLKFGKIIGDAYNKRTRADDKIIEEVAGDSNLDNSIKMKEWDIEKQEWVWM